MTFYEGATLVLQTCAILVALSALFKVNGVHTMLNSQKTANEKTIAELREAKTILEQAAQSTQRAKEDTATGVLAVAASKQEEQHK